MSPSSRMSFLAWRFRFTKLKGPRKLVTRRRLCFTALAAAILLFAAALMMGRVARPPGIDGDWFATVESKGERPLEIVMTFFEAHAGATPRPGEGCWTRVSTRKFSIAFTLPAEDVGASVRKISGTLALDEMGWLRGVVTVEKLDSSGRMIDSIPGVVHAKPVNLR
jgi:hypothetical protein